MRVIAVIFGVILLLPGACSLIFMVGMLPMATMQNLGDSAPLIVLWLFCLAVSFGGLMIIRSAMKS